MMIREMYEVFRGRLDLSKETKEFMRNCYDYSKYLRAFEISEAPQLSKYLSGQTRGQLELSEPSVKKPFSGYLRTDQKITLNGEEIGIYTIVKGPHFRNQVFKGEIPGFVNECSSKEIILQFTNGRREDYNSIPFP